MDAVFPGCPLCGQFVRLDVDDEVAKQTAAAPAQLTTRLAQAIHDWRSATSMVGCGWQFASSTEATGPLCPCPADAAAILAHMK